MPNKGPVTRSIIQCRHWKLGSWCVLSTERSHNFSALTKKDEVLYHSKIHPEQKCHTLTSSQIASLHDKIKFICETAVSLNADAVKFPEDWLFRHRWVCDSESETISCSHILSQGKGKKIDGKEPLKLVSPFCRFGKYVFDTLSVLGRGRDHQMDYCGRTDFSFCFGITASERVDK